MLALPQFHFQEQRLVWRAEQELGTPTNPERADKLTGVVEQPSESALDTAKAKIAEAENDASVAQKRIEVSVMRTQKVLDGQEGAPERVQERIQELNQRQEKFRTSLPDEFLRKTFVGQVFQSLRFGISEDGRTFESANFDRYRTVFSESAKLKSFKVLREDKDGKVYGFDDREGLDKDGNLDHELREDGIRLYRTIDDLEEKMNKREKTYTVEKIKEDPKYAKLFDEQNGVRSVKGQIADTSINLDDPPAGLAETALKAKRYQEEFKRLIDQVPDSAKQTAILRLIAGAEITVDRDGKMLMAFSSHHGPEYRALAQWLFKGVVGHTRIDDDGRYAVEVEPESVIKIVAKLRIIFMDESMTFEEMQKNLELIRSGAKIETPGAIQEQSNLLNGRLETIVANNQSGAEETDAGRFLSGMRFEADEAGRLTFSHESTEAVSRYFQQIDDSDTFESSDQMFKGIRLKMEDGVFHSNDLPLERTTQLLEKLQDELRSPVIEGTERASAPDV